MKEEEPLARDRVDDSRNLPFAADKKPLTKRNRSTDSVGIREVWPNLSFVVFARIDNLQAHLFLRTDF